MTDSPGIVPAGTIDYIAEESAPQFRELKSRRRNFVFPMAVFFLIWYLVYVVLAGFFPAFMGHEVGGHITIGLLFGLGQFVTTFIITMWYVSFANKRLDPLAEKLREDLERQGGAL